MTIIQLHRATQVPDCECHRTDFNCNQGRRCPERDGASACSELLEDEDPYDGTHLFRGVMSALGIVAVFAALGYILPWLAAMAQK